MKRREIAVGLGRGSASVNIKRLVPVTKRKKFLEEGPL